MKIQGWGEEKGSTNYSHGLVAGFVINISLTHSLPHLCILYGCFQASWWLGDKDTGSISESGRSPEDLLATYSSILAWRIPWTEESGGLKSMGMGTQGVR